VRRERGIHGGGGLLSSNYGFMMKRGLAMKGGENKNFSVLELVFSLSSPINEMNMPNGIISRDFYSNVTSYKDLDTYGLRKNYNELVGSEPRLIECTP
jgi:hypothetical protein